MNYFTANKQGQPKKAWRGCVLCASLAVSLLVHLPTASRAHEPQPVLLAMSLFKKDDPKPVAPSKAALPPPAAKPTGMPPSPAVTQKTPDVTSGASKQGTVPPQPSTPATATPIGSAKPPITGAVGAAASPGQGAA